MKNPLPPVAVQYCATFLRPEMFHIYRQITALHAWKPHVICQKREETERFPFDPASLSILPKPATHALRRIWIRQFRNRPVMIYPSEVRRIAGEIGRIQGRVLHIYFGNVAVHLLPLLRQAPVPVVISFHGADVAVDAHWPAYRTALQETFQHARLVMGRSEALLARLRALGCPGEKLRLHRTGIPLEHFPFLQRAAPAEGPWRFFQACRLIPKKGLHTALRAFAAFTQSAPERAASEFFIAGEGPLLGELKRFSAELGLAGRVHFLGFLSRDALLEQFYRAHLFLHPSETGLDGNQEGVPNAMLEAMATGLPVVATRHGGIPEAVREGVGGFLVNERDHEALGRVLVEITAAPACYAALSAAAACAVTEGFEQKCQARKLESYYTEALSHPAEALS